MYQHESVLRTRYSCGIREPASIGPGDDFRCTLDHFVPASQVEERPRAFRELPVVVVGDAALRGELDPLVPHVERLAGRDREEVAREVGVAEAHACDVTDLTCDLDAPSHVVDSRQVPLIAPRDT